MSGLAILKLPGRLVVPLSLRRAVSLTRYSLDIGTTAIIEGQLMKYTKKQSGFVIEGLLIVAVAIGASLLSMGIEYEKAQREKHDRMVERVELIESGRANDGKLDW